MGTRFTLLRPGIVAYQDAWSLQQRIAADVRGGADESLILLEHPPTYTLGARGDTGNLLLSEAAFASRGAAVVRSDRGGDVTFHGPGQIVGYPIVNLRARGEGPVWYVRHVEALLIDTLARFDIVAHRAQGRPGVWCSDEKIAAIGVRVSGGVTTHGFALNVNTDLTWFRHIVPCGLADAGVTSMREIARGEFALTDVENAITQEFAERFNVTLDVQREAAMTGASVGR
ncbi:MAG TPA: lipoyl(octanoyl) transferase LipB [Dehalococcoidia bacterium]